MLIFRFHARLSASRTERDWRIFREDYNIAVRGGSVPKPLRNWKEAGLVPSIMDILDGLGFEEPTPVQRSAIPIGTITSTLFGSNFPRVAQQIWHPPHAV